jgi:hypothetical protein
MASRKGLGITIRELNNCIGVHQLDDTHGILLVTPGDSGGKVASVCVNMGRLDFYNSAFIVFKGYGTLPKGIANAGCEVTDVTCRLDTFRKRNISDPVEWSVDMDCLLHFHATRTLFKR